MPEPFQFTADTNIEKALLMGERVEAALKALGLKCVDKREEMCPAAAVETLREASLYHDIPLERILAALNDLKIVPPPAPEGPAA